MRAPFNIADSDDSERLKLVIDATGVGIWDWQIQTGVLTFNHRWAEIIGYTVDELQPIQFDTWANNLHPDDLILTKELLEKHWRGELELYEVEARMKHKKGHYVWVLASGKTVEWQADGKPQRMLGTHQDITLRKQAEEKLVVTSQLLHESQKIAEVGGWELDLQTRELYWTDETYRIHDTSPEEFNPTVDAGVSFFLPESKKAISAALDEAITSGKGYDLELETYTTKGRKIDVRTTCQVTQKNGETVKLTGIFQDITEKKRSQKELQQSHALYRQAETMGNMGHWSWDLVEDRLISCSDQFARIYDMTVSEALDYFVSADAVIDLAHPDDKGRFEQAANIHAEQYKNLDIEYRLITPSGNTRYVYERSELVLDNDGVPLQAFGTVQDITAEKEKELALRQVTEAALDVNDELVFQKHALDEHAIVSIADVAGNITYVNDKFCAISGYDREELLGNNHKIVKSDEHPDEFFVDMWNTISSGHTWHGEIKNTNKTGNHYWVMTTIVPTLNDKGKPYQYAGIRTEITERKQTEEKLERIAHYDLLTDLPNRVLLADRLSLAMVHCHRRNQSLAVAYLDLDGFKVINDTNGHDVGDKLLVTVSQRMKEALREGDTLARIGGDEFILVLVDLERVEDSEPVLKRLLKAAADPVTVGDTIMQVSASIGVTFYPQDGVDADQLMRHADQAMYLAKQAGKNQYHLFDTVRDNAINVQQQSIGDVRSALGRHEFVLHYQPKVNMRTGEVIGVEALIRWQHPDRGLVPPLEFLPLIEGHDISLELGEWVITTAMSQISQWQSTGVNLPISVNISAYQLQQTNFTTRLAALLAARPEVNANSLELEVLETSALNDINQVSATMNTCQELGVRFALDDFGTGYSSLTYLRRLPAHMIKIDQSFVRDMLEDVDDLAIIEGVVGLAKSFRREVIAEGVETIEHGVALLQLGCELAQGYGIARPMPAGNIPEWVSSWKADDSWQALNLIEAD